MKTVLDMSLVSDLVMIDISIWNKTINRYSQMSITVDTGASVTTISTDILKKLGYDVISGKEKRIITASSVEYVRTVNVDGIKIGEIEIKGIEVYAHTFPESSFSLGVLGLNVLKNFDVSLLFSKNEMEIYSI